jgi:hemin uptake protein HemP
VNPPFRDPRFACADPGGETSRKRLSSRDLFDGDQEILIDHAGQEYRLRITRQGKLILTK